VFHIDGERSGAFVARDIAKSGRIKKSRLVERQAGIFIYGVGVNVLVGITVERVVAVRVLVAMMVAVAVGKSSTGVPTR
jgi:hypothetical protein